MLAHTTTAAEGESSQVEEAAHHLISFVRVGDQIYDMDNLASKPHWVAECDDETFPAEAMKAAKSYIDRRVTASHQDLITPDTCTPQSWPEQSSFDTFTGTPVAWSSTF